MRPRFFTLAVLSTLSAVRVGFADVTFEFPFSGTLDVQVVSSPFVNGAKRLTTIPLPQIKDGGTLLSVNLELAQFSLDSTIPLTFGAGVLADAYFTADLNGDPIEQLHTEVSCSLNCQNGSAHAVTSGNYLLWGDASNPISNAPDELDLFLRINHAGSPGSRSQTAANGKVLATYSSPVLKCHGRIP
jgi:hypothetical protein